MHFDPTINLGTLVSVALLLIVFVKAHISNVERLSKLETKLEVVPGIQQEVRDIWNFLIPSRKDLSREHKS